MIAPQSQYVCLAGRFVRTLMTLGLVAFVGCAGKNDVRTDSAVAIGLATLDGQPITGGMLTIVSIENPRKRATGILRPDGTFRLAGAPLGKSLVIIDTSSIQMGDPSSYMPLPEKYAELSTSDLHVELEPGENENVLLECKSLE